MDKAERGEAWSPLGSGMPSALYLGPESRASGLQGANGVLINSRGRRKRSTLPLITPSPGLHGHKLPGKATLPGQQQVSHTDSQ